MSSNKLKNTLLKSHRATQSNDSAFSDQVGGDWYKKLKIQPLDYAMDNNLNACHTKVVKYISRYNLKHKSIKEQIFKKNNDFFYVGRVFDPVKRFELVKESIKKIKDGEKKIKICGLKNPGFGNYLGIVKDDELNRLYNSSKLHLGLI